MSISRHAPPPAPAGMTPQELRRYRALTTFGLTPAQARAALRHDAPVEAPVASPPAPSPRPPPGRRLVVPPLDPKTAPRPLVVRRTTVPPASRPRPAPGGWVSITERMDDPVAALRTTGGGPIR